ncbi:hypothetical protein [Arthrospiribacter ruber]|uniref:Uncharacterized protein n=1 Tax=Arthrospiribacter ruber TaxID=2487934 RepID=A0A951J0W0_9BACT|nr:hypothetical protein [Arthrospiribacter ruber]MBW3469934.1 hypothetical protein [Arthrospiribacter ruber]
MRKLTDIEHQIIKIRLDDLQIAYSEIYLELLDHYVTALEQEPENNFIRKKSSLDEKFAWSVVKSLEKTLEKNTNKRVAGMLWDSLKFWNYSSKEVIITLFVALIVMLAFLFKGIEGLFLTTSILSLVGIIVALKKQGKGMSFSFNPKSQKPFACVSKIILQRLGLHYGSLSWLWVVLSNWGESDPGPIGTTLGAIICASILLYNFSLIKVSITYQKPEHLILS